MKITVVNTHVERYMGPGAIYIGRSRTNNMHFGNPFTHLKGKNLAQVHVETREESVQAFRDWIEGKAWQDVERTRRRWIIKRMKELAENNRDITLMCFCAPQPCHGDILKEMILSFLPVEKGTR